MRLIICEKENAAKRVSEILSEGRARKEKRGRVSVYSFDWEGMESHTIGLRGHILNLDFPDRFNNWSSVDPRTLIDVEPIKKLSNRSIGNVLKGLSRRSEEVIVATDFDREGELIGSEAVEFFLGPGRIENVKRAHFSSLTRDEILESFSRPQRIDTNLVNAAETRQTIDLVWGATLTRFISLAAGRLGHEFLSLGRVQTPTLSLLVDREKEIKGFVPRPYWTVEGEFSREGEVFRGHHTAGDIFDREKANAIYDSVKGAGEGTILSVKGKERLDRPPHPFNTTTFLKAANSLGLTASRAMSIAEDLYTSGYISYPRTDNTVYPKGLDLRGTVVKLDYHPYKEICGEILSRGQLTPTRGSKQTTDHPPIYPTEYATKAKLASDRWKVYDLVVRRFFATLMEPARVHVRSVRIDVNGEVFSSSGITVLDAGWRRAYHYSRVTEIPLPDLAEKEIVQVTGMDLNSKETKPPNRYSQGSLIQEMERLGLGTKSTRHEIIQKLYDRRYVEDSPPRPTLSGEVLISCLQDHSPMITKHEMTSKLEEDMASISSEELTMEEVVEESRAMLRSILEALEKEKEDIGKELKQALNEQDVVGKCPRCNNDLLLARSKWGKRYIRCSKAPGCSRSYPLPQRGRIGFTDESCEVCRSPMILLYRRGRAPFKTCVNPECPTKGKKGGD